MRDFEILYEKYYLADTRYYNPDYLLYPYHNVCYYLQEQAVTGKKRVNKKELFNLFHSSLCNIVERIFGVIKQHF